VDQRIWYSTWSQRARLVYRWVQDAEAGTRAGVYKQSLGRRLVISLVKYATVFQAEIYTILACAHEIQANAISEKYVSICSDSQAALKDLQVIKTSPHWYNSAKRH